MSCTNYCIWSLVHIRGYVSDFLALWRTIGISDFFHLSRTRYAPSVTMYRRTTCLTFFQLWCTKHLFSIVQDNMTDLPIVQDNIISILCISSEDQIWLNYSGQQKCFLLCRAIYSIWIFGKTAVVQDNYNWSGQHISFAGFVQDNTSDFWLCWGKHTSDLLALFRTTYQTGCRWWWPGLTSSSWCTLSQTQGRTT